ncbi:GAF domain-containing protein [Anabaena sphaerica FACHB-251]|uniref:histidine kinase n=1 Tax=Anabaena sphaerica FACHB-251 TaxID=2692883 RepID=A0A926WJE2_9NOST|nr:GAF domain-containing protein [Anabaena sphaerica]MBD2295689.1 GAF domain-containing protein [Anabaena sphaerica FACHB-251]
MLTPTCALTPSELKSAIVLNPLIVTPDTTVMEAIAQMSGVRAVCSVSQTTDSQLVNLLIEARSSCVLVVENNQPVGIFTERDVVRLSAQQQNLDKLAIREVMVHPVVTLRESEFTDLFFAVNLLQHHRIRHLPVVDEQNQLVGLLTHESLRQKSRTVDLLRLRLVNEVMTRNVIYAAPDISVLAIARLMAENRVSSVMIVKRQGSLKIPLGIVTERDLVQFQAVNLNFATYTAADVMSTPVFCVNADESLWTVQQMMEQRFIQRLAVTGKQGELLGIVTQSSILQALNPLELYKLTEVLEQKVLQLEAEKIELLENRTIELEQQVENRTITLRKKVEQEQLITKVASQIRSSLDLQDILDTTVTEIRTLLKCDRVIIYQFRPDFSGKVIAESVIAGGISVLHTEPHDPCITPEYLEPYRQGEIRVINDIHLEALTQCHQEMLIEFDVRAKLMVPIIVEDQIWGLMLTSYRDTPHNWEFEEIELVRQLSIQLSIAIQQTNSYQQIQIELRQRQQAELELYQLNQQLEARVKERTEELSNISQRLEIAVKSAEIGIWDWDLLNDHLIWDDRMYELYGVKASEFSGAVKVWEKSLHPDDAADTREWIWQAIRGERDFDPEFRIVLPDGKVRIIKAYAIVQRNSQGEAQRMIGVNMDITERKQAEQKINQQAQREHLLRETTQRIRQSLDLATIFNTAAEEIRQLINADRVGIFKFDPDSNFNHGEFVSESVVTGFKSALENKINDHCFGEQYAAYYQQGRMQVVADIENGGLSECHRSILAQFQVRANLIVPLLQGKKLWGLLCIHQCSAPRHWETFEIELVQQIAEQLAIAIQQSSLYEQVQSELIIRKQAQNEILLQLQQQKVIQEITQQIRSSLDVNQILATVTQKVQELMQVERVIVFRLFADGKSQIVEEVVADGYVALKDRHWDDETWSPEILECYWQGKPRIVPDVMNDIWTDCLVEYSLEGKIKSKIVAPILQELGENEIGRWVNHPHNKLWGILVVHACSTKRIWEETEAQLLQQIANQLAIAVQQADLFEQLQKSLAQEKEISQMRSRFISMASHEFRTPLAIISSSTGILQKFNDRLSAEKKQGHLETIQTTIKHIVQLLDDVLMINRAEAEKMEFKPEALDIIPFCEYLKKEIESTSSQHKINFYVNTSQPILDDTLIVKFDPKIIRQILTNLLSNAIKYSPENSVINFSLIIENYQLIFKIKDAGIGIPKQDQVNLFSSFYRASNVGNISGTGLGLVIVKRCVDLHKGQITLDSEVGQGTTFTVIIPNNS